MADDTLAANRTRRPAARVLRALGVGLLWGPQGLAAALRAESGRWPLWVPVFVGFGVAGYFTLATEPPPWVGAAAVAALCPPVWLARRRPALLAAMLALLLPALGFAAAQFRTWSVAAPIVRREVGPVPVTGRVLDAETVEGGVRILVGEPAIERLDPADTPARVRLKISGRAAVAPPVGARIRVLAKVQAPPDPVAPDATDFGRNLYFAGIGAVGFTLGKPELIAEPPPAGPAQRAALAIQALRGTLAARIEAAAPGAEGAVIAAVLAGRRGAIPEEVAEDFRGSGLAHLLAVAGLHVGIIAGLVFGAVRAVLSLIEPVALRFPIKKWAAAAALPVAIFYMFLVGAPVPTQRSVFMHGMVLLAVLADRRAVSMRTIALAATLVLLAEPETLLGPSFQMSFGAVGAMIATYEALRGVLGRWHAGAGRARRVLLWFAGIAITSVVASLGTTPFTLFHFQQVQYYGVLGNLLAIPIMGFWVMPCGLVAYLAMPLGLESGPLAAMALGVTVIMRIAHWVTALPGSTASVPAMPMAGLVLISLGGLWLMIWRRPWRLAGLAAIVAGILTIPLAPRPDILVDGQAKVIAVRDPAGALTVSTRRAGRFAGDTWLRLDGAEEEAETWPRNGPGAGGWLRCDGQGCLYRPPGRTIALLHDRAALVEDCPGADLVVSLEPARGCRAGAVIDFFDLWRKGAHAVYFTGEGLRIVTVRDVRGDRPWSPPRQPRARTQNPTDTKAPPKKNPAEASPASEPGPGSW